MRTVTRAACAGLAALGGSVIALLGPQALLLPMVLGAAAFFLTFSELAILLLQDYMPLVTVPLGRLVALPAMQASLPFIVLWAIAAGWRTLRGGVRFQLDWGLLLHVSFALFALANYLAVAVRTEYANTKLFLLLSLNLISYVAGATFTRDQLSRVFSWIMGLGLVVGGMTYYAYLTNDPTMPGRFSPYGMNPIWACRLLLLGGIAAFFAAPRRGWSVAYLAFALPAALLTGSRGPLLAAVATAVVLGLAWLITAGSMGRRIPWRQVGWGALVAIAVALPVVLGASPDVRNLAEGSTAHTRAALYQLAFGALAQHGVFGLGIGGFPSVVDAATLGEELTFPHNMFLEVGAELGLVGLAIFGALIAYFFASGLRHLRQAVAPLDPPLAGWGLASTASFLFLFVAAQFSGDLVSNHSLWFYMGLMSGAAHLRLTNAPHTDAPLTPPGQENPS